MRRLPHPPAALAALLLAFLFAATPARGEDAPPEGSRLAELAFLVGEFHGEGKSADGSFGYQEQLTAAWILGGQALEIRSKSTVGGTVVFEDRRIISYDAKTDRWRMRQWAEGRVRVYTGVRHKHQIDFEESAQEHGKGVEPAPAWHYEFTPENYFKAGAPGFRYTLKTKDGEDWKPFLAGKLGSQWKDPGKAGGLGLRQFDATVAGMQAQVHHPDGKGPYPLIVFSPGGGAESSDGYRPYGRWFATWGYVTVIVAFNDKDADERAGKFGKVIDWALAEHAREGSPLHGLLDTERVAAAGHSRGGYAALVAGAKDERIDAVLALAPSGPSEGSADAHAPAACVIIGTADQFRGAAQKAYAMQRGERVYIEIEGMEHMLTPREQVLKLVRRSTCFLEWALKGDARYREPLLEAADGVTVQQSRLETK